MEASLSFRAVYFLFSFTSSYGAENAYPPMSVTSLLSEPR